MCLVVQVLSSTTGHTRALQAAESHAGAAFESRSWHLLMQSLLKLHVHWQLHRVCTQHTLILKLCKHCNGPFLVSDGPSCVIF